MGSPVRYSSHAFSNIWARSPIRSPHVAPPTLPMFVSPQGRHLQRLDAVHHDSIEPRLWLDKHPSSISPPSLPGHVRVKTKEDILHVFKDVFKSSEAQQWLEECEEFSNKTFMSAGADLGMSKGQMEFNFMQILKSTHTQIFRHIPAKTFRNLKTEYVNLDENGNPDNLMSAKKKEQLQQVFKFLIFCEQNKLFAVRTLRPDHPSQHHDTVSGLRAITFHEALMPFLFFILTAKPNACKPQKNLMSMFVLHVIKNQFRGFCDFNYKTSHKTIILEHHFDIYSYSWWSKILARKLFKLENGRGWDMVKVKQNHNQVVLICRFENIGNDKRVIVATRGSTNDIYSATDWEIPEPSVGSKRKHDDIVEQSEQTAMHVYSEEELPLPHDEFHIDLECDFPLPADF